MIEGGPGANVRLVQITIYGERQVKRLAVGLISLLVALAFTIQAQANHQGEKKPPTVKGAIKGAPSSKVSMTFILSRRSGDPVGVRDISVQGMPTTCGNVSFKQTRARLLVGRRVRVGETQPDGSRWKVGAKPNKSGTRVTQAGAAYESADGNCTGAVNFETLKAPGKKGGKNKGKGKNKGGKGKGKGKNKGNGKKGGGKGGRR